MTHEEKKQKIQFHTERLLAEAYAHAERAINKALNSGALDIDGWDADIDPMILPKIIVITLLENEADQYKATGTSFEKRVKKEVANLKRFV